VRIKTRFLLALAVAAIGVSAGLAMFDRGSGGFGIVRAVSETGPAVASTRPALAERLAELHQALVIRAEQEGAWRNFADAMYQLDRLTRDFERRTAASERLDTAEERTRHALILGSALGEIGKSLSPDQFAGIRRATDELTSSVICRGLASS